MSELRDTALDRLRDAGLRVTRPRVTVLEWLDDHPHSTASEVIEATRALLGSVSTQAVYDVLAACERQGLVRRIETAGHSAQFETRSGDGHHHLICRSCSVTVDVDHLVGDAPCTAPMSTNGYTISHSEVFFWGYCAECVARMPAAG